MRIPALLALLVALLASVLLATPAAADGWDVLRQLRGRLEAQPQATDFRQEYVPAGFTSGDSETGRLTLALPGCLRWDYDEPDPKSFLLCEETIWTWNPGEMSGRKFEVDPEEDRGLDLLRLGVERLAERYTAELVETPGEATAVHLARKGPATEIAAATLTLAAGDRSLAKLTYRDIEGNTTRFEFSGPQPLEKGATDLRPPDDLTWIEE